MWRLDKMLRNLSASMIVCNKEATLQLTGNGDCFEPEHIFPDKDEAFNRNHSVLAIGSGGAFARAAATALLQEAAGDGPLKDLDAKQIAEKAVSFCFTCVC